MVKLSVSLVPRPGYEASCQYTNLHKINMIFVSVVMLDTFLVQVSIVGKDIQEIFFCRFLQLPAVLYYHICKEMVDCTNDTFKMSVLDLPRLLSHISPHRLLS